MLAAGDGNAADAPLGNGFERKTVIEAKLWGEPMNAPTSTMYGRSSPSASLS